MNYFTKEYDQFFIELAQNNNKKWFDENRKRYTKEVKEPFYQFVNELIVGLSEIDERYKKLQTKDVVFRINRDIRFAKDKTPYKLHMSAGISSQGKKASDVPAFFFQFGAEQVLVGGGMYQLEKEKLLQIREGIAHHSAAFKALYSEKKFVATFGDILGEKNKILPKSLKESAVKEALIYNKQFYFHTSYEDQDVLLRDDLLPFMIKHYQIAKPICDFFETQK